VKNEDPMCNMLYRCISDGTEGYAVWEKSSDKEYEMEQVPIEVLNYIYIYSPSKKNIIEEFNVCEKTIDRWLKKIVQLRMFILTKNETGNIKLISKKT
jgi:hypothetical protein